MAIEIFNRYEKKFQLNQTQFEKVVRLLEEHMDSDKHCKDGRTYNIANIYYDTFSDDLISRSIEKPIYKEKLRLRSYGVPSLNDMVFLEIKKKYNGMVNKRRTKLQLKEAYEFIETKKIPPLKPYMNTQVLEEIKFFLSRYELESKLYLTYDRIAFFDKEDSDFRVTFDKNIKTRRENVRLEAGNYGNRLLEKGIWLMEIKTSKGVPLWFVEILNNEDLFPRSFSKYGTEYKNYIKNEIVTKGEEKCSKVYLTQQQQEQKFQHKQQSQVS